MNEYNNNSNNNVRDLGYESQHRKYHERADNRVSCTHYCVLLYFSTSIHVIHNVNFTSFIISGSKQHCFEKSVTLCPLTIFYQNMVNEVIWILFPILWFSSKTSLLKITISQRNYYNQNEQTEKIRPVLCNSWMEKRDVFLGDKIRSTAHLSYLKNFSLVCL